MFKLKSGDSQAVKKYKTNSKLSKKQKNLKNDFYGISPVGKFLVASKLPKNLFQKLSWDFARLQ